MSLPSDIPFRVFITGITGSLGKAVTNRLLHDPKWVYEISGYSRCEHRQQQFPYKNRVTLYLGDIRDRDRLVEATRDADIIFHFAALKHVDLLEKNPEESIETNIRGTMNVLHAQRVNDIKRVVLSSTDKSVDPINVYGASKMIANKLVLRNPNNVVCVYGNVIASNGSVIPLFVNSLKKEKSVNITDKEMTRFLIRLDDAAKFVIESGFGETGGLKIPTMKSCKVTDLAKAVASAMSIPKFKQKVIGIRPGEKIHEYLSADVCSLTAERFKQRELVELIRPSVEALL